MNSIRCSPIVWMILFLLSIFLSLFLDLLHINLIIPPLETTLSTSNKFSMNSFIPSDCSTKKSSLKINDIQRKSIVEMSYKNDGEICYSLRNDVMPEDLIYLGAPKENFYSFPRNRSAKFDVTFDEMHQILFGKTVRSIYDGWENHFQKKITYGYATHLKEPFVHSVIHHVIHVSNLSLHFVVEIGSFTGMSALQMGQVMRHRGLKPLILCIDTWLGDMNMWINRVESIYLGIVNGRPQVYEQFFANIIGHNLTRMVIPFSTTSILGARFLHIYQYYPQVIFLDSAHEQGETLIELALFWPMLQPGGILLGDDWDWTTVRCDVKKFALHHHLHIEILGGFVWAIKKPLSSQHHSINK